MNLPKTSLGVTMILAMCCASAAAQEVNVNITGAGARAEGMAGAFIGVADDATALVWNPAGIATLERPEASAVFRSVSNSYEISTLGFKEDDSHGLLNFLSVAYPMALGDRHLVLAAAYQRQIDLYSESQGYSTSGGVDTFTPGFGLRLSPVVFVGAAANIWFGTGDSIERATAFTPEITTEEDFSGFNANLGVLFDMEGLANPVPLRIGATLRTPFTLTDDETFPGGTATSEVDMPTMFGVGVSYRVGENLTLAADIETRMFGDSEVTTDEFDAIGILIDTSTYPLTEHGENLNEIRIGAEYLIVASTAVIPLRVGFRTVPTLSSDYDDNFNEDGQVVGGAFTLGSGIILDRASIDASLTFSGYDQMFGSVDTYEFRQVTGTLSGIFYF